LAPVFLGAEDHPPRDRRPKCLTGSAITLVRSAQFLQIGANPRGRHARVADPSGVECQRDGSDQGQRMKAGDGALTPDRHPAPSRDAYRSPAVPQRWSHWIVMFQAGVSRISMPPMNTRRATRPTRPLARGRNAPNFAPSVSFRLDQPSRKGSSPAMGGRLPGRLRWRDQSPVPALPGCAIASAASCSPAKVFGNLNP
jgi:hypothetical protein